MAGFEASSHQQTGVFGSCRCLIEDGRPGEGSHPPSWQSRDPQQFVCQSTALLSKQARMSDVCPFCMFHTVSPYFSRSPWTTLCPIL